MAKTINTGAEDVAIANLKPHPRNVNEGDFGAIQESIEANGFFGRIVVNRRTKHILAGNHRYAVAKSMGFEKLPVEWVDCDDETELRILLADNRTARLGHDNEAALAALLAELAATERGLPGTGFDGEDLDRLIADLAGTAPAPELLTDPDDVPESAPTRVKAGEIWQLGRHRLLCGDSTDAANVARVLGGAVVDCVLTDPPYGLGDTTSEKNNYDTHDDTRENLVKIIGSGMPIWQSVAERVVLTPGNGNQSLYPKTSWTMAWFTPAGVGRGPWGFCCWQPILCYGKDARLQHGEGCHPDAIVHTESSESLGHPCSKPVKFWAWLMERVTAKGGDILEPFAGSGTGIIAAETLGRACYAVELSPAYCDIILARWEAATGGTATLLEAGNGRT